MITCILVGLARYLVKMMGRNGSGGNSGNQGNGEGSSSGGPGNGPGGGPFGSGVGGNEQGENTRKRKRGQPNPEANSSEEPRASMESRFTHISYASDQSTFSEESERSRNNPAKDTTSPRFS